MTQPTNPGGYIPGTPWDDATCLPLHGVAYIRREDDHLTAAEAGWHTCDAACLALYGNAYVLVPPAPWWRRAWRSR